MPQLYRMLDAAPAGVFPVADEREAKRWNAEGCGIFWTVNTFAGARRIENLRRIDAWAIDMDEGTKAEQRAKIERSPLIPSRIVEVKRGFHVYWNASDGNASHWNAIVLDRLVPYFGADKNARDLARILRVPGFLHLKDPADPFLVRDRSIRGLARPAGPYSERQMVAAFPDVGGASRRAKENAAAHAAIKRELGPVHGDDFFDRLYNADHEVLLSRMSGHWAVRSERYTFRQNANGNRNILVDGKGTSAWIDRAGRIGSLSHGGPTLAQWLRWYGISLREAVEIIKREFPEMDRP